MSKKIATIIAEIILFFGGVVLPVSAAILGIVDTILKWPSLTLLEIVCRFLLFLSALAIAVEYICVRKLGLE